MLRLRVRSKAGGVANLTIDGTTPLLQFAQQLQESTKIPFNRQKLLTGFPPTALDVASYKDPNVQIATLFHSGDVITVEESDTQPQNPQTLQTPQNLQPPQNPQPTPSQPSQTSQPSQNSQPPQNSQKPYKAPAPAARGSVQRVTEGGVVRRKIADDNSCLFNAVGYVLEGELQSRAKQLRALVAYVITHSPDYTEAMLGKPIKEYANWITLPNSWGGGIEVSILSEEYQTEICTFDILSKIPFCYGEGKGYTQRVYLIYDGLHYDALPINLMADEGAPPELDITVFSPDDEGVRAKMAAYVESAHKAGQFTNMATFQLMCGDCNKVLRGEKEMAVHAAATGHGNFVEVKK